MIRVLADPTRARIVELLAEQALCTCHLVEELGATQPNVSNHLRVLREAGLIVKEPAGRFTYYRLVPERLETVAGYFTALADTARSNADARREC